MLAACPEEGQSCRLLRLACTSLARDHGQPLRFKRAMLVHVTQGKGLDFGTGTLACHG